MLRWSTLISAHTSRSSRVSRVCGTRESSWDARAPKSRPRVGRRRRKRIPKDENKLLREKRGSNNERKEKREGRTRGCENERGSRGGLIGPSNSGRARETEIPQFPEADPIKGSKHVRRALRRLLGFQTKRSDWLSRLMHVVSTRSSGCRPVTVP